MPRGSQEPNLVFPLGAVICYSQFQLPWWLSGSKNLPADAGDVSSIPGSRRSPGEGHGNPPKKNTHIFLPGKSHGQRCLAGYSPWGHKEVETTEQLNLLTYLKGHVWLVAAILNGTDLDCWLYNLIIYVEK